MAFAVKLKSGIFIAASCALLAGFSGFILSPDDILKDISNLFISFSGGLLVLTIYTVVIQAIISNQSSKDLFQHRQIAILAGLYERFHSPEMIEVRCRVNRLLQKSLWKEKTLNEIHELLYINSTSIESEKDWVVLSSLFHFFENLADLHERKLVESDKIQSNFRKYFKYYNENPVLRATIELSDIRGQQWHFISRWVYLEQKAGLG